MTLHDETEKGSYAVNKGQKLEITIEYKICKTPEYFLHTVISYVFVWFSKYLLKLYVKVGSDKDNRVTTYIM